MQLEAIITRYNGTDDNTGLGTWDFPSAKLAKEAYKALRRLFPGVYWQAGTLIGEHDTTETGGAETPAIQTD